MRTTTVRYENQLWNIDIANNELYLPKQKKVRVNIDDVFDLLSDEDQNKIAELSVEGNDMTEEEIEEMVYDSQRLEDKYNATSFGYQFED